MLLHVAIICSIAAVVSARKYTPYINPSTYQTHPLDLNELISNEIETAKPFLADGVPQLSIPSLRDFIIPYLFLSKPKFEIEVWNFRVTGLENFNVLKVDADPENNLFKFQIEFPYGEGNGAYRSKGSLLNMKFDATGPMHCHATNIILDFELKTELVHRDGHDHLQQVYRKIKVSTESLYYIYMHNLYPGNTKITDIMNGILNDNSFYMFYLIVPIFENHLDGIFDKAIEKAFEMYTYDQLFP